MSVVSSLICRGSKSSRPNFYGALVLPSQDQLAYHAEAHFKGIAELIYLGRRLARSRYTQSNRIAELMYPGRRLPRTRSCGSPSKAASESFVVSYPNVGEQHSSISLGLLPRQGNQLAPGTTKDWNPAVPLVFGSAGCSPSTRGTPSICPILTTPGAGGFVAPSRVSSLKRAGGTIRSFSTPRGVFLESERVLLIDGGCHPASNVFLTCYGGQCQERGLTNGCFGKKTLVSGRMFIEDELVPGIKRNRKVTLCPAYGRSVPIRDGLDTQSSKESATKVCAKIAARKNSMGKNSMEIDARVDTGASSLVMVLPRSEPKEAVAIDSTKICDAGSGRISQENSDSDLESGFGATKSPLLSQVISFSPLEIPKTRENECAYTAGGVCRENQSGLTPRLDNERWAGPAFTNSPPPSSLPFPKFSMRQLRTSSLEIVVPKEGYDDRSAASGFLSAPSSPTRNSSFLLSQQFLNKVVGRSSMDMSIATQDLRRILNLDLDR